MTPRQRARAQPEGRAREKPGAGGGEYFRIAVRPKGEFRTFRYHDVGQPGHIQRLAGKRASGSWDTQAWLISKKDAHLENGKLVPDTEDARGVLEQLGSEPSYVEGDRFEAKPRPNVPEKEKPTAAQKRAQQENIKKAQAARKKE
jgi:hypothetical protein